MLLHSQQVHILYHTLIPLFPRPFCRSLPPNSQLPNSSNTLPFALFTCPNYLSLLCLNLTERSSTLHISAISLLDLLFCNFTPAMYLSILNHICAEHPSICCQCPCFCSIKYSRSHTSFIYPSPSPQSLLQFTNKLAISHHLLHAAVILTCTALSNSASQSSTSPK